MSNIKGWTKGNDLEQVLRDHVFNKDKNGAWQRDVDMEIVRQIIEKLNSGDQDDCEILFGNYVEMEDSSDGETKYEDDRKGEEKDADVSKSESKTNNANKKRLDLSQYNLSSSSYF